MNPIEKQQGYAEALAEAKAARKASLGRAEEDSRQRNFESAEKTRKFLVGLGINIEPITQDDVAPGGFLVMGDVEVCYWFQSSYDYGVRWNFSARIRTDMPEGESVYHLDDDLRNPSENNASLNNLLRVEAVIEHVRREWRERKARMAAPPAPEKFPCAIIDTTIADNLTLHMVICDVLKEGYLYQGEAGKYALFVLPQYHAARRTS
jgi:hypothetical protein